MLIVNRNGNRNGKEFGKCNEIETELLLTIQFLLRNFNGIGTEIEERIYLWPIAPTSNTSQLMIEPV